MEKPKVAILASGAGTTAEAFIRASTSGFVSVQAKLVICNNPEAGVLNKVTALNEEFGLGIKSAVINSDDGGQRLAGGQTEMEQARIIQAIEETGCEAVLLLGYMKLIGHKLIAEYGWQPHYTSPYQARMLNTHPGPLPATKGLIGLEIQQFILKNKLPYAAQTLHLVSSGYDEGPVIAEHRVEIQPGDTAQQLFDRVREIEKRNLPLDVDEFLQKRRGHLESHIE